MSEENKTTVTGQEAPAAEAIKKEAPKKSSAQLNSKHLQGKDLINIGIYTAIYFVVVMAVAMLGYIPIFLVLLVVLVPLVGSIPIMLYITKIKKFGMIWISSIIMGILMILTGMTWMPIIVCAITGLIAELILKRGDYNSPTHAVFANAVFHCWCWGNYLPLFLQREAYFADRSSYGPEYVTTINSLLPNWMAPVLLVVCFVCGIAGGYLGKLILKKHFTKSGIV